VQIIPPDLLQLACHEKKGELTDCFTTMISDEAAKNRFQKTDNSVRLSDSYDNFVEQLLIGVMGAIRVLGEAND
jgi:hypothetical protein